MYLAKYDDFRKTLHNNLVAKVIGIDDKVLIDMYDMININNFNPKKVKVDRKSYKEILIYYIGYETRDQFLENSRIQINKTFKK